MNDDDTLKLHSRSIPKYVSQRTLQLLKQKTPQPYLFPQSDFYLLYLPVILLKL